MATTMLQAVVIDNPTVDDVDEALGRLAPGLSDATGERRTVIATYADRLLDRRLDLTRAYADRP